MKLRMALEEDQFRLRMKDASKRYQFRMNDAEKIEVSGRGAASVHVVTVVDDSPHAIIDTEYSTVATWLINGEPVILYDPFIGIRAILTDGANGMIVGDGVNMDLFIMRRYTIERGGGVNITIMTNGPMTPQEIIAAVTLGWNT